MIVQGSSHFFRRYHHLVEKYYATCAHITRHNISN